MTETLRYLRTLAALALAGTVLLAWPAVAMAQPVSGSASAVGMTTTLADTGPLADSQDIRDASQDSAGILSFGSADVLHAATGSSITNWSAGEYVASEASLADLVLSVAGNS